jgi:protein-arginine kinase activator protein McsA
MNILENIKAYFNAKSDGNVSLKTPEGVCPNCWGKQEWDGKFYKKIKANNITPEHDTYNNFIHEVSQKLGRITLKEDSYKCENCQMNYEKQ